MTDVVYLHFQRGFTDDTVAVAVDGTPRLRREKVTTSPLTALALALEVELPDGGGTLDVEVPTRHLRQRIALDGRAAGSSVVAVNLTGGELVLSRPAHPVEYE